MALTLSFSFTDQTVDGETLTFTDSTTYSSPARNTLVLIMRAYHQNQDEVLTRKELVINDPTTVSSFVLNVDQSSSGVSPIDGVHKVTLYALTSDKYGGVVGGKYQINGADEDSYTDAELTALSEDTHEAWILPTPKLIQEETNIFKNLSDHDIDLEIPELTTEIIRLQSKRIGAQAQFQQENYTNAARILEIE